MMSTLGTEVVLGTGNAGHQTISQLQKMDSGNTRNCAGISNLLFEAFSHCCFQIVNLGSAINSRIRKRDGTYVMQRKLLTDLPKKNADAGRHLETSGSGVQSE